MAVATVLLSPDGSPLGSEPPNVVFPAAALTRAQQALRERPDQHGFTVSLEGHLLDIKRLADGRALVNLVAAEHAAELQQPPITPPRQPTSEPTAPLQAPALLLAARHMPVAPSAPRAAAPSRRAERLPAALLLALLFPLAALVFGLAWPLTHRGLHLAAPHVTVASPSPRVSPSPSPTASMAPPVVVPGTPLGPGDRGPAVRALQARLRQLGYFTYRTDTGFYGPITIGAVGAFQLDQRIHETGVAGLDTIAALNRCDATCVRPAAPQAGGG